VLTAVMRRPWPVVGQTVLAAVRDGRGGRQGVLRAVPRLPMALRARRRLPAPVERDRRLLGR
jgi:hypothetical protein